jgi:RNA polymerase sigma-70 factor (ECF subfamily)
MAHIAPTSATAVMTDMELARRICNGDHSAFERLMRQCNRQLFRIARGILKNDRDAEDALQEAYITAYTALPNFRGESKLSTWLARIVINEALGRLRKKKSGSVVIGFSTEAREERGVGDATETDAFSGSPEEATLRAEVRALIERKLGELPAAFRTVFVMRELEEMTVEETAHCLGIPEATVRSRLFRARGLLRASLEREVGLAMQDVFSFAGARCDRIVAAVLDRIGGDASRA